MHTTAGNKYFLKVPKDFSKVVRLVVLRQCYLTIKNATQPCISLNKMYHIVSLCSSELSLKVKLRATSCRVQILTQILLACTTFISEVILYSYKTSATISTEYVRVFTSRRYEGRSTSRSRDIVDTLSDIVMTHLFLHKLYKTRSI